MASKYAPSVTYGSGENSALPENCDQFSSSNSEGEGLPSHVSNSQSSLEDTFVGIDATTDSDQDVTLEPKENASGDVVLTSQAESDYQNQYSEPESTANSSSEKSSVDYSSVSEYLSAADHFSVEEKSDNEAAEIQTSASPKMATSGNNSETSRDTSDSSDEDGTPTRRPCPPSSRNSSTKSRRYPKRERKGKPIFTYDPKTGEPKVKRFSLFKINTTPPKEKSPTPHNYVNN